MPNAFPCSPVFTLKDGALSLAGSTRIALEEYAVLFLEKDLEHHAQEWPTAFATTLNCIPKVSEGPRVQ